jgi:hypothetical protein
MSGSLHRVALWLRLTLVCLVLTGISAPAPATGYREAVVAIAGATSRELAKPPAAPAPAPAPALALVAAGVKVAPASWPAPIAGPVAASISPLPPRRLFLLNRALLC